MALSVVDLYSKILPKTNCKECGFPTCIAFAGMVVSEKHPLGNCPYIPKDVLEKALPELEEQYREGKWLKKDMAAEALEWARQRTASMNLEDICVRIGGKIETIDGIETLVLPFFNTSLCIRKNEVLDAKGTPLPRNDQTFIFNHMAQGGIRVPTGEMKSFKEFPNTVSKMVSMKAHVEEPLIKVFAGGMGRLAEACGRMGGENVSRDYPSSDFAWHFQAFPKVPVVLLFWNSQEDFGADVKLLFDQTVTEHLDIESIMFLSEHICNHLTEDNH